MKRLYYTIKVIGSQPLLFSLLFCGLVIFLVFSNTVITNFDIRYQIAIKYLAWGSAFLSSILMAFSFRPEDSSQIEIEASLPIYFYKSVGIKIFVCDLMIIFPFLGVIILIASLTGHGLDVFLARAITILISNVFFFGNVAILGASLARRSVVGIFFGLLLLAAFSLSPLPSSIHPFLQDVNSAHYNNLTPIVYLFAGIAMFSLSLAVLKDVNSLLIGRAIHAFWNKKDNRQNPNKYRMIIEMGFQKILSVSMPVFIAGAVYEAIQWLISGWLPIMLGGIIIVWGILSLVGTDDFYPLAIDFPRTIIMLSMILLPTLVCDTIPSDKRSDRISLMLSCISLQTYLTLKIIGAWIAIFISLIIGAMPFYIILGINALMGFPQYLTATTMIFLLAVVPFYVYISSISVLIGTLANHRPAFAIGAIISITASIAFALITNSIMGNILFPSGTMAIETLGNWLSNQIGVSYLSINERPIAPLYLLTLPLLAGIGQIAIVWRLVTHRLTHGDR